MNIQLSEHFTYKKLIKFTIPTIMMMIFTQIYGVVDGLFVSNCVGTDSFAAVNLIMPVIMILGTIGFMIGTGGSALVSKTIGEGEKEKANQYFSMLIYLVIIAAAILSILGLIFIKPIASLLGANGVVAYGIIMYIGFIFSGTYMGYSIGSAPIIGYHYGAENKEELKSLFKKSIKMLVITSIVMTLAAEILSKPLASIFVSYDKELLDMTTTAIRLFAISYIISGINIFSSSFFTALNNGAVSAAISFLRTLVFQVAMILILPAIWGLNGIWLAVVAAELLALVVSIVFLIMNKKKYQYA